jgi:molybdopterin/thiamine biosynthesis adenylyltransferase
MPRSLLDEINAAATECPTHNGQSIRTLSQKDTQRLIEQHALTTQEVEIAALENDVIPARYLRNQKTMSSADQIRLLKSKVAVIGLGGLGGSVIEIRARAGVGQMVLMDGDRFEDHNLNRQFLCTRHQIGRAKAVAAKERIGRVNTAVTVVPHATFLTADNAAGLIENCDVAVDCLDNIPSRFDLETAAKQAGIPMVSAAVAGVAGHITTIFPEDAGLQLIYGNRHSLNNAKGAETVLGCLPQAVAMIAAVESAEVLKILLHQTSGLLRNKLWIMDLTDNTFEVLSLGQ